MKIFRLSRMSRGLVLLLASATAVGVISTPAPAHAGVLLQSSGRAGAVGLLNDFGSWEGAVPSQDTRYSSVACHVIGGRRAQFARIGVRAYNARPGAGNDWQYAQATAIALGTDGTISWGTSTALFKVWDNKYSSLPPVSASPSTRARYNPAVLVRFYDASKREVGSRIIAPEVGAWWMSAYPAPRGGYWYVGQQRPVMCA